MLRATKRLMFCSILWAAAGGVAHAGPAACDRLAGSTIFVDMLYGMAGGAILSGLYMAAVDNFENSGSKAAYAALGGSAIGLGVGITEVFRAQCNPVPAGSSSQSSSSGKFRLFASPTKSGTPLTGLAFSFQI